MEVDDDDNLSTTSTLSELANSDEEWNVESILAEKDINNEPHYLVEWEGFRLHEATWEPQEHLPPNLRSDWEDTKRRIERGEEEKFKISRWREAVENNLRQKHERHEKRNALRQSRGIDETLWNPPFWERIQAMKNYYPGDSDECEDEIDFDRPDNPRSHLDTKTTAAPKTSTSAADRGKKPQERKSVSHQKMAKTSLSSDGETSSQKSVSSPKPAAGSEKSSSANTTKSSKGISGSKPLTKGAKVGTSSATKKSPIGASRAAIRSSAQNVGNVFSGGITRKKRKSIAEVASDGKTEKYLSYRYQRLLEKDSRDQENKAPAQLPKGLRSLDPRVPHPISTADPGAPAKEASPNIGSPVQQASPDVASPTVQNQKAKATQPGTKGALPRKGSLKVSSSASAVLEGDGNGSHPQPEKRRKSVSFNDYVVMHSIDRAEDVGSEPSLFVDGDRSLSPEAMRSESAPATAPAPATPKLSENSPTKHGVEGLGIQLSRTISTQKVTKRSLFGSDASRPMMLIFHEVPQNPVSSWVDYFKADSQITFTHACMAQDFFTQFKEDSPQYSELAAGFISAPADADTLEIIVNRLKLGSQGVFCYTPQYCILLFPSKSEEWEFKAKKVSDSEASLKYIVFKTETLAEADLSKASPDPFAASSELGPLPKHLDHFTNLDRRQVFPPSFGNPESYHIFLAFPSSASQESRFMAQWVSFGSKVDCVVYDSFTKGDWQRFRRAEKGIMIVHEEVVTKVRLFPYMFEMLTRIPSGKLAISVLQRACDDSKYNIGDIGPRLLLALHKVFFMTPSFIASQPRQAYLFLGHFIKGYATSAEAFHRGKIVFPADFENWLVGLAAERTKTPAGKEKAAHEKDMHALLKMVQHVYVLMGKATEDETLSPVVLAPAGIDPNDEQSLVNWFGWWTTTNLEMYGRLYVIGSTSPIANDKTAKMTRALKPVRYVEGTTERASIAASQLVRNDDPRAFKECLQGMYGKLKGPNPVMLFFLPVAYWEADMAYGLGDVNNDHVSFSRWFQHLLSFNIILDKKNRGQIKGSLRNTLAGFFYTPDGDWHGQLRQGTAGTPRRPWLAFFRPVNPHERPWTACELLIWDANLEGRYTENQPVYESDLDEVHRRLIGVVIEENRTKNPNHALANVWIGGWRSAPTEYTNLLDITLDTLDKMCCQPRTYLPASSSHMEDRGWKRIGEDSKRGDPMDLDVPPGGPGQQPAHSSAGQGEFGDDEEPKLVFHPPRGYVSGARGASACKNELFAASNRAQAKGQDRMTYKWQPTTQWYARQVEEGRDLKHIMVDSWQNVFRHMKLPTDE